MVARFSFMLDFTSRLTFGMIVLEMGNHAVYTSFKNFLSHTLKVFGCFFNGDLCNVSHPCNKMHGQTWQTGW